MTKVAGITLCPYSKKAFIVILSRENKAFFESRTILFDNSSTCCHIKDIVDESNTHIVIGVDSSLVRFLDIDLPHVVCDQVEDLLSVQIESRLPLGLNELSYAWTGRYGSEGTRTHVAVIKKECVSKAVETLGKIQADCTIDAAGLAFIFKKTCSGRYNTQFYLWKRSNDYLLIRMDNCGLVNCSSIALGSDQQDRIPEITISDIRAELQKSTLDYGVILFDNDSLAPYVKNRLQQDNVTCEITPIAELKNATTGGSIQEEYLAAAGLAQLALESNSVDFNFMGAAKKKAEENLNKRSSTRLRNALIVTAALVALCAAFSYWSAKRDIISLRKALSISYENATAEDVLQFQAFREAVARARPDMLDIFEKIQNARGPVVLDSFEFEKGKCLKITASAPAYESVYAFQKQLESQNSFSDIRLLEPRLNDKDRRVQFTLTLNCKNFSK